MADKTGAYGGNMYQPMIKLKSMAMFIMLCSDINDVDYELMVTSLEASTPDASEKFIAII